MRIAGGIGLAGLLAIASCDVSTQQETVDISNVFLLAPIVSTDSGIALPQVDSVRFSVYGLRSEKYLHRASVPWSSHGDTLAAIATGESLLVKIEGVKLQVDSSVVAWWSGTVRTRLAADEAGGVWNVRIPVVVGDTVSPRVVSRRVDTVRNADSIARIVWHLASDCGCVAVIDGKGAQVLGDSVEWMDAWPSGSIRTVVASYRDKTGNLLRDTATLVRRSRVAMPTIVVRSNEDGTTTVLLRTTTPGASLEYSLDSGGTWSGYADSIRLAATARLFARANASGMDASAVASGDCVVKAPRPIFSVPSGTSWNDVLVVRLSSGVGDAGLQYSEDGIRWNEYRDSIAVGSSVKLRARLVRGGRQLGDTSSAEYFVRASMPSFSVVSGSASTDLLPVRIACATPGAAVEFSVDSGASWHPYRDSVILGSPGPLWARSRKEGLDASDTAEAVYAVSLPAPTFSVPSGTRSNDRFVLRMGCATPGSRVEYSTDSLAWFPADSVAVTGPVVVWARSRKQGMAVGPVSKGIYFAVIDPPVFSLPSGSASNDLTTIGLSSTTPGAQVQYSLDSAKTWRDYGDSLVVGSTGVIFARACKAGMAASELATALYSVAVAKPVLSHPSWTVGYGRLVVTASSVTPGARVQYSYDGLVWENYADSLVLWSSTRLVFRALKDGMQPSPLEDVYYCVSPAASLMAEPPRRRPFAWSAVRRSRSGIS